MPELREEMYCSQQICIPPLYPYLLRQYAKAAIRSQPTDLLKWSTAYFRCLSLNIPPPVKPRLEYPIPRDYYGITPGWLKTLLYQLQNSQTVSFKVLWDRWLGACLQHDSLIKILCLGGFTDNTAIPLLHFLALCIGHLTENLTQTMILICELLTEEPEGGSAMITLELFLDLYQFLANLDASKPQCLKNLYFTDQALGLVDEKVKEKKRREKIKEKVAEEVRSESSLSTTKSEITISKKETISEISCPSIGGDDENLPVEEYLKLISDTQQFDEGTDITDALMAKAKLSPTANLKDEDNLETKASIEQLTEENTGKISNEQVKQSLEDENNEKLSDKEMENKLEKNTDIQQDTVSLKSKIDDDVNKTSTTETKTSDDKVVETGTSAAEEEKTFADDTIEKLSSIDLDKTNDHLISQPTIDDYIGLELDGELTDHTNYLQQIQGQSDHVEDEGGITTTILQPSEIDEKIQVKDYEEVYVDIIPGIGPKVSENLIKALCDFMRNESINQHGMIMPRNIRHYNCPPLEILDY